jgi:peroxiredoxin
MGMERATLLVRSDGLLKRVGRAVRVAEHVREVLESAWQVR